MFQEFLAGTGLGIFPAIGLMIFLLSFVAVLAHFLFGRKGGSTGSRGCRSKRMTFPGTIRGWRGGGPVDEQASR